jgi:hypothetical protein
MQTYHKNKMAEEHFLGLPLSYNPNASDQGRLGMGVDPCTHEENASANLN